MNNCPVCNKRCEKEYCFKHKPKKNKTDETAQQWNVFMNIWQKRKHISEISGKQVFSPPTMANFHHLLWKSKFPEAKFDENNIIILTMEEHEKIHLNPTFNEEINKRVEELLKKYL